MTVTAEALTKLDIMDESDEPYPVGSTVCLKTAPNRHYTVLDVQVDVDADGNEGHIRNPDGGAQHFYTLQNQSGRSVYWWHHQLELIF